MVFLKPHNVDWVVAGSRRQVGQLRAAGGRSGAVSAPSALLGCAAPMALFLGHNPIMGLTKSKTEHNAGYSTTAKAHFRADLRECMPQSPKSQHGADSILVPYTDYLVIFRVWG